MDIEIERTKVNKIVPLRISGEIEAFAEVAIIKIFQDGVCGYGEVVPFSFNGVDNSWKALNAWLPNLAEFRFFSTEQRFQIEQKLFEMKAPRAIIAGVDMALHDWLGKIANLPLYDLLGLRGMPYPDTSLTIGISSPDEAVSRMEQWEKMGPTRLWKVKLGHPDGTDSDKSMFMALAERIKGTGAKVYVDANGGWNQDEAYHMAHWLKDVKECEVLFIEQPLVRGEEENLAKLSERSPLPIFADESILHSQDMQDLVSGAKAGCHGINIKLSKCGGISEALRMIILARHHNLQVMLGCFSNTILGNSAAAHISSLVDYVDLDSHLNLKDDPFTNGATWSDGRMIPNNQPGLGVKYGH